MQQQGADAGESRARQHAVRSLRGLASHAQNREQGRDDGKGREIRQQQRGKLVDGERGRAVLVGDEPDGRHPRLRADQADNAPHRHPRRRAPGTALAPRANGGSLGDAGRARAFRIPHDLPFRAAARGNHSHPSLSSIATFAWATWADHGCRLRDETPLIRRFIRNR